MYPNPNNNEDNVQFYLERQYDYDMCKDLIKDNPRVPIVEEFGMPTRQQRVHTCFEPCKLNKSVEEPFTIDERPVCETEPGKENELDAQKSAQ